MAASGYTMRDHTISQLFDDQDVVYDWLDAHGVSWRVYSEGFPFFALMPKVQQRIVADVWDNLFRGLVALDTDCRSPDTLPKVIFIEPQFTDGAEPDKADDDHPTTPITRGQDLIRRVYAAVTGNPQLWSKSVLIITYDEHGGFFDHVEPLALVTPQNHGESYTLFTTTGVRVPAIIVSPFVDAGSCFSQPLDHTSILRMLADKYTPGHAVLRRRCGAHAASQRGGGVDARRAAAGRGSRAATAAASGVRRDPPAARDAVPTRSRISTRSRRCGAWTRRRWRTSIRRGRTTSQGPLTGALSVILRVVIFERASSVILSELRESKDPTFLTTIAKIA